GGVPVPAVCGAEWLGSVENDAVDQYCVTRQGNGVRMLDLFSGIGGMALAAEWAGIETVAFCEIEPYCQKVLKKHWPTVPIYTDVRKLTRERLEKDGVIGNGRTIDLICGGYPCQPFSVAGKRRGTEDDRYLWPEMF